MSTARKWVFAIILFGLLAAGLPISVSAQVANQPQLTVTVSVANVRQGPGTGYPVIGAARNGDTLPVTGRNTAAGWYQVQLPNGRTGWISGSLVRVSGSVDRIPEVAAPALPKAASRQPGNTIVFQTSSGGDIYVINSNGSGLRKLTTGMDPALSPDGKQVAFTRWHGSGTGDYGDVWVINTDGSGERQIQGFVNQPKSPSWSPDGKQIVISMQRGGTLEDQILPQTCRPYKSGDPQPPRTKIVDDKICAYIPADPHWSLRLINVADGSFKDLPSDIHSFAPSWNPANPNLIVFASGNGLKIVSISEGSVSDLTGDSMQRSPAYAPDGGKIATSYRQGDHWEVHVMNADGSNEVRLTQTPLSVIVDAMAAGKEAQSWNNAAPSWSPDGKQIAFVTDRTGPWEIWVMNANGSNPHPLMPASVQDRLDIQYHGVDERVISWR